MKLNENLRKKYKEKPYEKEIFYFLKKLNDFKKPYAIIGGIGFASYFNHFSRKSSDIDILIEKKSYKKLKLFLQKNYFEEIKENYIIKQFDSKKYYFRIDVVIDSLVLAIPPKWKIVDYFSLTPALEERVKNKIVLLKENKEVFTYTIPKEWHFLFKLFPPIDAHHLHDIFYLLTTLKNTDIFLEKVKYVLSKNKRYQKYFKERLKDYKLAIKKTIWYQNSKKERQETVLNLIDKIILNM